MNNSLLIILLSVCVFILTSSAFIFYALPHYDEHGEYTLFGTYYNIDHILKLKKSKNNSKKLKKIVNNYKNKNISLEKKMYNFSEQYKHNEKTNQQNISYLQSQNQNLKSNIGVLKSQLDQQQDFIKTQNIEHKQENKQKEFIKKRQFSNVSKNTITNERPQFGNMFSKSLKKTTTTST